MHIRKGLLFLRAPYPHDAADKIHSLSQNSLLFDLRIEACLRL